jgi:single-strand DNA-binding protein
MPNLNRVFLIGNVTKDVELRYTPKGTAVTEIDLAVLDTWDDRQTGQKRSKLKVVGERLQLLGSRQDGDVSSSAPSSPARPGPAAPARAPLAEPGDIPIDDM